MKSKKSGKTLRTWVIALCLALLALMTLALLGSMLFAAMEPDNVLELGEAPERRFSLFSPRTGPASASTGDSDALWVGDDDGAWNVYRRVNVFRDSYVNSNGEVTVKSVDGEKVIAPGTSGKYNFSIRNTDSVPLNYTLTMTTLFELAGDYTPIVVRLRSGDEYLLGSATQWRSPAEGLMYTETDKLAAMRTNNYTFEWQWPFEDADAANRDATDAKDTLLGNEYFNLDDANFELDINVTATPAVTPTPTPTRTPTTTSTPYYWAGGVKTGDARPILIWALLIAVGAGGYIWLRATKKKDKNSDDK